MNFLLAALVVVIFSVTIEWLDLAGRAREVVRRARDSVDIIREPSLDDETKERRLQEHAVRLFGLLGILVGGSLLALLLPLFGVWSLEQVGMASLSAVLSVLERIDFLAGAAVLGVLVYLVAHRIGRK